MDEQHEEFLSSKLQRLEALPQRFDIWQVDARQLPTTVQIEGRLLQPWVILVVSATDEQILSFELAQNSPTIKQVCETILKAINEPVAGEAHRPTQIQTHSAEWTEYLQPRLEALNIDCTAVEEMDHLGECLAELGSSLDAQGEPGLLDMPGVTPKSVASLFDAAAVFYEQAPWQKSSERPIRVECSRFESGPWYAVLMGQAGLARGLVLYDSLDTLQRIQQGTMSEEENARLTAALAVTFGEEQEPSVRDVQAARQHGWRLIGLDAFPLVYRIEPGLAMRPPLAWELELLEGCLRSIPAFVRKKTRRVAPFSILAPIASGELPIVLSWV
jgi:hypothetical protein